MRRNTDPCYNESFHFRLEPANIDATNIVLAIHQPDNKGMARAKSGPSAKLYADPFIFYSDRILGRLVLGSFMFARGRGMAHW